jgi:hypothetical protein
MTGIFHRSQQHRNLDLLSLSMGVEPRIAANWKQLNRLAELATIDRSHFPMLRK